MSRSSLRRILLSLFAGLCYALIVCALYLGGLLEVAELKTLDRRFRAAPPATPAVTDPIVIVAIDQNSLQRMSENGHGWPWPRDVYDYMITFLTHAGAKAVVFDMYFSELDIARAGREPGATDKALEEATAASGRVFHGYVLKTRSLASPQDEREALVKRLSEFEIRLAPRAQPHAFANAVLPSAPLIRDSMDLGFLNLLEERDGIVRRMPLVARWGDRPVAHMSVVVARRLLGIDSATFDGDVIRLGDMRIPTDPAGRLFLSWYRPQPGANSAFRYVPAVDLLRAGLALERSTQTDTPLPDDVAADLSLYTNRIVYIGSSEPGLGDVKATPLSGAVPGVEAQATALLNLLRREFVRRVPRRTVLTLVCLVCVLVSSTARGPRYAFIGASVTLVTVAGIMVAGQRLLITRRIFLDTTPLVLGALFTFLAATFVNYVSERRHSKRVRGIFEHYLDKSVVKTLIVDPDRVRLGGEERCCTALFTDVANFTNISEKMTPPQLVQFMNLYLNEMSDIIMAEGGLVDKYIGDMIVAIFGAPNDLPDHPLRACTAVLRMRERIAQMQGQFKALGASEVFARTGLSSGPMVVGNMGSEERMNYTAMGDAMNLGSRLEGTNKVYGTITLVSEATYQAVGDAFTFREVDLVRVKGKEEPIRIYELLGRNESVTPEQRARLDAFAEALALYRAMQWAEAQRIFQRAAQEGDAPSAAFVPRCREYAADPPPTPWDGVYVMKTK